MTKTSLFEKYLVNLYYIRVLKQLKLKPPYTIDYYNLLFT